MGKKGSIVYQVLTRIDELKRFGQSKHAAKMAEKARCERTGEKWNPARVEGIYSHVTCDSYKAEGIKFAHWARDEKGCRTLEQARQYVPEYLQRSIDEGKSAWTVRLRAAALAKIYGCKTTDFGVELPTRHRENIHRSRQEREHDRHFSARNNRDLINFCKGTGLRRKEISTLTWRDIYRGEDGRTYVHVDRGKGGRSREVPVLRAYEQHIWNMRERAASEGRERVIEKIPQRADVHSWRREYAMERYKEIERERDQEELRERERERDQEEMRWYRRRDGRTFDREILREVSQNLGHNREDVIARHYLD